MNSEKKEVLYNKYCQTCEHWEDGKEIPFCDECLEVAVRTGTEKPLKYKEKGT